MADKKVKTMRNARQWAEKELELSAEVLADPENNFAISLEKLALRNWQFSSTLRFATKSNCYVLK